MVVIIKLNLIMAFRQLAACLLIDKLKKRIKTPSISGISLSLQSVQQSEDGQAQYT